MKAKRKFINLAPKTNKSKMDFIDHMDSLHAVVVNEETDQQYLVVSINDRYSFWLEKQNDPQWEILK